MQGGLSNQLVALSHAAAWALVLNRTLVLPHLLPHQDIRASSGGNAPLSYAGQPASLVLSELLPFDSVFAPKTVAGLRTISISQLMRRGVRPDSMVQLPEIEATMHMKSSSTYFDALGWQGLRRQPVELKQVVQGCNAVSSCQKLLAPMLVRRTFGGCKQQVLAFESLFSTIRLHSNWSYCYDDDGSAGARGRQCWPLHDFLSSVALPSLLTPQPHLQATAARAARRVVARAPAGARELGCMQACSSTYARACHFVFAY